MKKLILISVAIIALVFVFRPENRIIVAFGDSLVEGVGSSAGGGFVNILNEDLGVPIVNLGKSGDTTGEALARIGQVTELKPDITIVLLGGNDYLENLPREETYKNLKQIIEKLKGAGSKVVLLGLEKDFEKLAKEYEIDYVSNILEGIYKNPLMMSDDLHPNDLGYKLMAERIEKAVKHSVFDSLWWP